MPNLKGNAVIGQSGGPTAVINQSLVGVIEGLRPGVQSGQIGKILGAHHAVAGIVKHDFIDLTHLPQDRLERVAQTPAAALGSSRDKPDEAYCERIFRAFEEENVRYFFYIGGNDSSDACRIINDKAKQAGYDLIAYHVPKTIDNDLMKNDHTPGFGSAARFVVQAFMGDDRDNAALPGIKIDVVMGRHAGFLTAASMMARREGEAGKGDGPHLIYVPEVAFDPDKFLADVDRIQTRHGRCVIAVSEGIHDQDGRPIAAKLAEQTGAPVERDAHGNIQLSGSGALGDFLARLIRNKLGAKRVRADTFGYLQRCFAGLVSETDVVEARAVARKAAELALAGEPSGSVAIVRTSDHPYQVDYKRIELTDVAAKTKTLDPKYIVDGCDIDPSFRTYLAPILGNLPTIETLP